MDLILQGKQIAQLVSSTVDPRFTEAVIKQWTFGRPYTITPSIRSGQGAGQANLYSLGDAFLFVVAAAMHTSGIVPDMVKRALTKLQSDDRVRFKRGHPMEPTLLFLHDGEVTLDHTQRVQTSPLNTDLYIAQTAKDWMSYYVLNLSRLRETFERNADKLSGPNL